MRLLESGWILRAGTLCIFVRMPTRVTQLGGGVAVTLVVCARGRVLRPQNLIGVERMRDIVLVVNILRVPHTWMLAV